MKRLLIAALMVVLSTLPARAGNRIKAEPGNSASQWVLKLESEQLLAGIGVAIQFAQQEDDIQLISASFEETILQEVMLKEVIPDNRGKALTFYAIVLDEELVPAGEGTLVTLNFQGKDVDKIRLTPTTIGKQHGVSLVTSLAEDIQADFEQSNILFPSGNLPTSYNLARNYPNPFNATTQIRYSLPENTHVNLEVYNSVGQRVKTLVDEYQTAGHKQAIWDGKNDSEDKVASGVYLCRIVARKFSQTQKMSLLK